MDLAELMWNRHSAFILGLATRNIMPGSILEIRHRHAGGWDTFWTIFTGGVYPGALPELVRHEFQIWQFLPDQKKEYYKADLVDANIVQHEVKHSFELEAGASLPQYGLDFSGKIKRAYNVTMRVSKIQARVMENGARFYGGVDALLALRKTDEAKWEIVNDDYFVKTAFYTTELRFVFHSEGEVSAKAELEKANLKTSGKLKYTWLSNKVLTISGEPKVPFAVRGVEI